jgi:hypothetical protein
VDRSAERDLAQRKSIAHFRSGLFTGHHGRTDCEGVRSEDVGALTVLVFDQGDACRAVRIVLDADDLGGFITTGALEVDETITLVVTTADVTAGDTASVVTATGFAEGHGEALLRRVLGDLLEGVPLL